MFTHIAIMPEVKSLMGLLGYYKSMIEYRQCTKNLEKVKTKHEKLLQQNHIMFQRVGGVTVEN